MAQNHNDFQFNWAGQGTDKSALMQQYEQNKARIAELEAELKQLDKASANDFTDQDLLDFDLASNRARAYDMGGTTTALGRIESRMGVRAKDKLDTLNKEANDAREKELKRSELEKQIRELQIRRAEAKTQSAKDIIDAQLKDLGNKLTANGGTYTPAKYEGVDVAEALKEYYENTENTSSGRRFKDNVTPEMRTAIKEGLRSAGQDDLANEIEAMKTTGEKNEAKQKEAAKRQKIKAQVKATASVIAKFRNRVNLTPEESIMLHKAEDAADSLGRNFGEYVKLENGIPKYTAKD